MHMPGVFGEIGRKIQGWYRPICASFRKLLRETSQAVGVGLPIGERRVNRLDLLLCITPAESPVLMRRAVVVNNPLHFLILVQIPQTIS
jgi:hypothetical protein